MSDFEKLYAENAFDFEATPIGSRECGLQRAAWRAGREAGMMEAAEIVNGSRADGADLRHVRDRILAAIGEGK